MDEAAIIEMYDIERTHWWYRARRMIILHLLHRFLPAREGLRVLDLGCGTGAMLAELERFTDAYGMDGSEEAVALARRRTGAHLFRGLVPDDVPALPGPFDCILMLDLLEHVEDDEQALVVAERQLVAGGTLVLTVPAYQWLYSPRDAYFGHLRRYSREGLKTLLAPRRLEVEYLSFFNTFLFAPVALERVLSRLSHRPPSSDMRLPPAPVNRALEAVFASERFLIPRMTLPFGISLVAVCRRT